MADLINLMRHLHSTEFFALQAIFLSIHQFFEKYLNFLRAFYLLVDNLVDNYAKNVDDRGRNFMCERTLPGLLV